MPDSADHDKTLPTISSKIQRGIVGFCGLSLIAAVCHAVVVFTTTQRLSETHTEQLIQVVSVPALMAVDYMDYTVAEEVIKSLREFPHLTSAALYDDFGTLLAKTPDLPEKPPQALLALFQVPHFDQRVIPLVMPNQGAGRLELVVDRHSIYAPLLKDLFIALWFTFILSLLTGGYFYYSTAHPLRRALFSLLDWAKARRNNETQIPLTQRNAGYQEISNFSQQIQSLLSQLHEQLHLNKIQQKQLVRQAYEDAMTGLKNRRHLKDLFTRTDLVGTLHLMFLDIDEFKQINDCWDYQAGDRILCRLAELLHQTRNRAEADFDEVHAIRFGGDEFLFLALNRNLQVDKSAKVLAMAKSLQEAFSKSQDLPDDRILPSTTIALSHLPVRGANFKQHFHHINALMSNLKQSQRATIHEIDTVTIGSVSRQLSIARDLSIQTIQQQMYYCFQPIYYTHTLEVSSLEALLRWEHPQMGSIAPDEFIHILEEGAISEQATRLLIDKLFQDIALFTKAPWFNPEWRFAINLSYSQLTSYGLLNQLTQCATRHRVPLSILDIEITERQITRMPEVISSLLKRAHHSNIRISLDDFGSGYSAWDGLLNLPIDRVKLDKSLLTGEQSWNQLSVIRHLANACGDLGLQTVCEGIENKHNYDVAVKANCDTVQGYFLCPPRTARDLIISEDWRHISIRAKTLETFVH